jgi:PPK2 family polyphosphate:nucleotide phosphotransferase
MAKNNSQVKKSRAQKREWIERFLSPYRITAGSNFRLQSIDPGDIGGLKSADKPQAKKLLSQGVKWLTDQQDMLYAQDHWGVLLVFQAMDVAGKDGTIKHVTSGINPQGCSVTSYKQPSSEELDHDYLWRYLRNVPARGQIGIFNRSYYEEVLVVKVHEELLARQKLHPSLVTKKIWRDRYTDIRNYEQYLVRNGILVLKFFLHVSKDEQKRRFTERLDNPEKNWKFSSSDVAERGYWSEYQAAYEEAIRHTASTHAPWYVVPADNKWFTRLVVAAAVADSLDSLKLHYPIVDADKRKSLAAARTKLEAE